jgi:hypothetical protein
MRRTFATVPSKMQNGLEDFRRNAAQVESELAVYQAEKTRRAPAK